MSSASVPDLSIVVPLFNEEESLPLLVEKLLLALRPLGRSFELVLVDDGSSDRTAEVLRQQAAGAPEHHALARVAVPDRHELGVDAPICKP